MPYTRTAAPLMSLVTLAALGLAGLPQSAQAQGLNGQLVDTTFLYPTQTSAYQDMGAQTITPGGAGYTVFTYDHVQVTPTQITITSGINGNSYSSATFNGYRISEVGSAPTTITGVSLDPSTTITGVTPSRISFDADDVFINLNGLSFNQTSNVTLDMQFASSSSALATPEPSSVAAFALTGLGAAALILRARRHRAPLAP